MNGDVWLSLSRKEGKPLKETSIAIALSRVEGGS